MKEVNLKLFQYVDNPKYPGNLRSDGKVKKIIPFGNNGYVIEYGKKYGTPGIVREIILDKTVKTPAVTAGYDAFVSTFSKEGKLCEFCAYKDGKIFRLLDQARYTVPLEEFKKIMQDALKSIHK